MSDPGAQPRLVVPEGLLVDETVRERLERQLAVAPASIIGIGAEVAMLGPGSSYRVHAEWAALEAPRAPVGESRRLTVRRVRGAVLLRPGTEFSIRDGAVEVTSEAVVVDQGAFAYDPSLAVGELQPATERGRPPFVRRPVVVFLGCEPGGDADWLRRLVNRLVRTDVEARIATPVVAPGAHLTRPCSPVEATIRALRPDVVVTLDPTAAAHVDAWCEGDRSTVVVAFDPELSDPMELVSWQIGHASGRLRARIGPWVDVVAFASLVGRLCAGPHPMPPADRPQLLEIRTPVREHWTANARADAAGSAPTAGCIVVTGAIAAPASARVAGLADNLEAGGVPVNVVREAAASTARDAAIVVLAGVDRAPAVESLIVSRQRAGLPTVVDVGPADVEWDATGDALRLTPSAAALVDACGHAISPAGGVAVVVSAAATRALVVPTLLARAHAAALRDARTPPVEPGAPLVIGWRIGAESGPKHDYADAVADGLALVLNDRRNHVELVGDPNDVPAQLRGHERVAIVPDRDLEPETVASWALHVWTPQLAGDDIVGDARSYEEASCAGVASVMPMAAGRGIDGYVSPFVIVDSVHDAEEWANAMHHVLDDAGVREKRCAEARRRADAVDSAAVSKAVVSRFAGWARYRSERAVPA